MSKHIIVDGSNIATEGRSTPSLAQLNDAVLALMKEYPSAKVSVVVDSTFGHRIARKEVAEFNKAIDNNELVCSPAGAVGRGDAFILTVAEKVNGTVLSNDSYQEFHGKHKWLFDPGRLIGGKPVPHVGWVFVPRAPVRGEASRRSVKAGKMVSKVPSASPEASKPMPSPKTPPPSAKMSAAKPPVVNERSTNEIIPYLQFVEKNPVGSKTKATVDSFAANGVVVRIGDVRGYVPITAISSPPPRSMRDVFKVGDQVALVITGYTASRRSVDLAVPGVVPVKPPSAPSAASKKSSKKRGATKKAGPAKKTTAKKQAARQTAKPGASRPTASKTASTKKSPAKKSTVKKQAVKKRPAKKIAAKKSGRR